MIVWKSEKRCKYFWDLPPVNVYIFAANKAVLCFLIFFWSYTRSQKDQEWSIFDLETIIFVKRGKCTNKFWQKITSESVHFSVGVVEIQRDRLCWKIIARDLTFSFPYSNTLRKGSHIWATQMLPALHRAWTAHWLIEFLLCSICCIQKSLRSMEKYADCLNSSTIERNFLAGIKVKIVNRHGKFLKEWDSMVKILNSIIWFYWSQKNSCIWKEKNQSLLIISKFVFSHIPITFSVNYQWQIQDSLWRMGWEGAAPTFW